MKSKLVGMITLGNLTVKITKGQVLANDSVKKAVYTQFRSPHDTTLPRMLTFVCQTRGPGREVV